MFFLVSQNIICFLFKNNFFFLNNFLVRIMLKVQKLFNIPDKGVPYGNVRFKGGGQPCFSKIPNWPTLKLHYFCVFDANKISLKIQAKPNNFSHTAKFWNLRLSHRPEIFVGPKNYIFPPRGDLPPPLFLPIMITFKIFLFFT